MDPLLASVLCVRMVVEPALVTAALTTLTGGADLSRGRQVGRGGEQPFGPELEVVPIRLVEVVKRDGVDLRVARVDRRAGPAGDRRALEQDHARRGERDRSLHGTLASYASAVVTGASSTTRSSSSVVDDPARRRSQGTKTASEPGRLIRLVFAWTRNVPAGSPSFRTEIEVEVETSTSPGLATAYPWLGPPRAIAVSWA
jgi:hypothetical protein